MERKKIVKIKDLGGDRYFEIYLFNALDGLDFFDKAVGLVRSTEKLSIKPFLGDLLKLAAPMDALGKETIQKKGEMNVAQAASMLESPVALLELGFEILKFQQVFIEGSEVFPELKKALNGLFNIQTSESQTLSATS